MLLTTAVGATTFIFLSFTLSFPRAASAFWPFADDASAANGGIVPSSQTPALLAVTNADPNTPAASTLPISSESALVAYIGPNGTPGDSIVVPATDRISTYLVRSGDTLSEIAELYGVSVNTIIWANDLTSAKDIRPGDTLIILPVSGIEHTVAKGDTLASLAKAYGADAGEIASYNGLSASASLAIGSTVIIPGGELAERPSPTAATGKSAPSTDSEPYLGGAGPADNGYWVSPIPGGIITQGIHGWDAVDIGAPRGTPIHAAAAGTVIVVRNNGAWNGGYGNYVVITHDNGSQTLYAHMSKTAVSSGEVVSQGEVIGYVGTTGETTGPHVHFEVRGAANPFRACKVGSVCAPQ